MTTFLAFAKRNLKELLRDPLSYMFCLGFPLVMLVIMTIVNDSIPAEANMTIFRIDNLAGGVSLFGLTFIMLFTCLSVSKDRGGSYLVRLYASPMRPVHFITGYLLPNLVLAVAQIAVTFIVSFIIAAIVGVEMNVVGALLALAALLPSALLFAGFGLLFGTMFNEKAAPGLCSIIISLSSIIGGVWFDVGSVGGVMYNIANVLPFYHCTMTARCCLALNLEDIGMHLLISVIYAVAVNILAISVFRTKMRADLS